MSRYYRRRYSNSRANAATTKVFLYVFVLFAAASLLLYLIAKIKEFFSYVSSTPAFKPIIIGIGISLAVLCLSMIVNFFINKSYTKYIKEHSALLKKVQSLNEQYRFLKIPNLDVSVSYDNESLYDNINPEDQLIYELVNTQEDVAKYIRSADTNSKLYSEYKKKVETLGEFDDYGLKKKPLLKRKRIKIEKSLYNRLIQTPTCNLEINVFVELTNINGRYKSHKKEVFSSNQITNIIERMGNKKGDFYLDSDVWNSICNVERGKVTNKIRFAVYKKYGYRCAKCGSPNELEIDHIFPISKGGKSNFNNLQALCHLCNAKKSNTVESNLEKQKTNRLCPKCGNQLVERIGKNGRFLGCSSYPNCKYTSNF